MIPFVLIMNIKRSKCNIKNKGKNAIIKKKRLTVMRVCAGHLCFFSSFFLLFFLT